MSYDVLTTGYTVHGVTQYTSARFSNSILGRRSSMRPDASRGSGPECGETKKYLIYTESVFAAGVCGGCARLQPSVQGRQATYVGFAYSSGLSRIMQNGRRVNEQRALLTGHYRPPRPYGVPKAGVSWTLRSGHRSGPVRDDCAQQVLLPPRIYRVFVPVRVYGEVYSRRWSFRNWYFELKYL